MLIRILIIFSMIFWINSCNQGGYYGGGQQNSTGNAGTDFGFSINNSSSNNAGGSNTAGGTCKPGGVQCLSGSDRDQGFLKFLSNGTYMGSERGFQEEQGIDAINCTPSDSGGFLVGMKVVLNGPFDPNGNNPLLAMQRASSNFVFYLLDSAAIINQREAISATFEAIRGEVDGNEADLHFEYRGSHGWKKVRVQGTFDANIFQGTINFENEKKILKNGHYTAGESGTLGEFKISTCVFKGQ